MAGDCWLCGIFRVSLQQLRVWKEGGRLFLESKAISGLIERLCAGGWQANKIDFRIQILLMQLLREVKGNVLKCKGSALGSLSLSHLEHHFLSVHSSTSKDPRLWSSTHIKCLFFELYLFVNCFIYLEL